MKTRLIRKPEKSEGSTDYNPWLTPEAFGKSGKGTVNLLGTMRASNSEFGEGIVLDVKVNGSMFSWTVKYSSPNYSEASQEVWRLGEELERFGQGRSEGIPGKGVHRGRLTRTRSLASSAEYA